GLIDPATCASMYPHQGGVPWSQTFMSIASALDSAMSVRWTRLVEAWVRVGINDGPRLPEASKPEVYTYARRQFRDITPAERADMVRMARGEKVSPERACHVVRLSFARFAAGEPTQAARVFRALMSGLA